MPAFLTSDEFDEPILLADQTVIGRREQLCDLAFPDDSSMSGRHCLVHVEGSRFFVRDLESMNGVFVNDERVDGVCELLPGDSLRIGLTRFRFHAK